MNTFKKSLVAAAFTIGVNTAVSAQSSIDTTITNTGPTVEQIAEDVRALVCNQGDIQDLSNKTERPDCEIDIAEQISEDVKVGKCQGARPLLSELSCLYQEGVSKSRRDSIIKKSIQNRLANRDISANLESQLVVKMEFFYKKFLDGPITFFQIKEELEFLLQIENSIRTKSIFYVKRY